MMITRLVLGEISVVVQIVFIVTLASVAVVRAWISYRRVAVYEEWRTRRLDTALQGVESGHKPRVIRACRVLEEGSATVSPGGGADMPERAAAPSAPGFPEFPREE